MKCDYGRKTSQIRKKFQSRRLASKRHGIGGPLTVLDINRHAIIRAAPTHGSG